MLLAIHGGDGSGEIWRGFSEALKNRFKVVTYDRKSKSMHLRQNCMCIDLRNGANALPGRGFSQSYLTGAQDYPQRLETDADDAARLIGHLAPQTPPIVIGNSSGAIVTLKLLARHPDVVATVISHEPPAARSLPDFDSLYASGEDIYATYRAAGMAPAYAKFVVLTETEDSLGRWLSAASARLQ